MPSWDQVSLLARVFQAAAVERRIPVEEVGTLAEWKARHEVAVTAYRLTPASSPDLTPVPATGDTGAPGSVVTGPPTWWYRFHGVVRPWFRSYLTHEPLSDLIIGYEPFYVPGLLQTRQYATEVISGTYGHEPADRLLQRIELRMLRQQHLARTNGRPQMWAIINEGALRNPLVEPATMRGQVRRLLHSGPHVRLQILPISHPAHDEAAKPITILRFGSFKLQDLIFIEDPDSALYPSDEEDRARYQKKIQELGLAALLPEPSRALLRSIENEL
ncbi:DUF5753 domain-containing protein [Actinomadura sp. NEAU-AAG7]|uniref:DUF5753 domain-containing protein n=1 Tax=Actinomadura sp. NEAU-AAG7 TaxID=2839640 RepID=UPI001BE49FDA|nr:DUF5753 domain-containing protein [Actinomadura sp. NEAU-AAG7]MBT2206557.1 hypothetical protein [Actinomadura sp. NEAU-AAG7]